MPQPHPTDRPQLSFFFDFVSPYTYLASTQVDALAKRHQVDITWEPAFLAGIMKSTGNQPPAILPARAEYMLADLEKWALHYRIPYRFSPHFPINSMAAMRASLALRARTPDVFSKFNTLAFEATWARGENIGDRNVLAEIAERAGADPNIVLLANEEAEFKAELKAQTDRAVSAGAFGMPFFVLEDRGVRETYFGNDRIALIEARLHRGEPWRPAPPAS